MIRNFINLIENNFAHIHVWHETTKEQANRLIDYGIHPYRGEFGYGFYVSDKTPKTEDDMVVLEYVVSEHMRILDLQNHHDSQIWHHAGASDYIDNPHLWKLMVKKGIDGVQSHNTICFYNPKSVRFARVYSGVIDDPLEDTDMQQLDEVALGGLQRCTAVTVNALLKANNLRPITLGDVPVDHPGVLRILAQHGLAYKPFPDAVGRTIKQFVGIHGLYDWYLLTPGHAMALIKGELFDAENKGADGRKLQAAFQITRR